MNQENAKSSLEQVGALLVVIGGALFLSALMDNHSFYHDDAYISLRYAQNFADGNGLVWNPGEVPVEGYTNFLFVVLCGVLLAVGFAPTTATFVLSLISVAALGTAVAWTAKQRIQTDNPAIRKIVQGGLAGIAIASYPLALWTLGGLEGPLFAALCAWGVGLLLVGLNEAKILPLAGLVLALAALTRLEGVLFAGVGGLILLWRIRSQGWKPVLTYAAPLVLLLGAHLLWRWSYYGDFLPNTFYAKVAGISQQGPTSGGDYLWALLSLPPFVFPIALGSAIYLAWKKSWSQGAGLVVGCVLLHVGFVYSVGGDHMPGLRFWLPTLALATLLLVETASVWATSTKSALLVCGILLVLSGGQSFQEDLTDRKVDPAAFVGEVVGHFMANQWPEGSTVALHTAGAPAFYAPKNTYIDMLGLNDAHIAKREITEARLKWQTIPGHAKGDGAYVLSRKPDYILLGPAQGTSSDQPWFLSDLELHESPEFHERYERVRVILDVSSRENYERYPQTHTGKLGLTYYARKP